jgi:hypothetical protein
MLVEVKEPLETSRSETDRRYYVSSIDWRKFVKRTNRELKNIYEKYINYGLFEAFLTNSVSLFESFLGDVLFEYFQYYPQKLSQKVPKAPAGRDVSAKDVIDAKEIIGEIRSSAPRVIL